MGQELLDRIHRCMAALLGLHCASPATALLLSPTLLLCLVPAQLLLFLPAARTHAAPREDKMCMRCWRKVGVNGDLRSERSFVCCLQSWMWLRPWLKFPRNIKQKIARSFGSGENKAKHPERDSSRAQCCCLDIQSAGPKGRPWSNIRYITKSRYTDVQTPSVQWHFALPIPKMGAGAALSLEGISEKYEGCLYGCF